MSATERAAPPPVLRLMRVFDAPRDLVWLAWTRVEMALAWWGPVEWPAVKVEQDLRVGGAWRACLRSPEDGRVLWQGGTYREVVVPERLVYTFKWDSDDHEDGVPVDTLVTALFAELPDNRTHLDFTHEGLKSAESLAGHRHGWTSTFARFDAWLAQQERNR